MNMKAATRTGMAWVLASSLALGEGAPAAAEGTVSSQASAPSSAPSRPQPPPPSPDHATDLDFGEEFSLPDHGVPARAPATREDQAARDPLPEPDPATSRSWAWWTAGLAALAAGGAAWYLHWEERPAPGRDNQVFTDAAD